MSTRRLLVIAATLLVGACSESGPDSDPSLVQRDERFIVEALEGQTVADVRAQSRAYLGVEPTVEPLFADLDVPGMSGLYVVEATTVGPEVNPWDRARGLRAAGGFVRVEPDLERVLEEQTDRERAAGGCFWDDGFDPPPSDRAWSLRRLAVPEAWSVTPPAGGASLGEGIRICHPDTGWTNHVELDAAIDTATDRDILDGDSDATDPLEDRPGLNPGHGTATGSVIASRGGVGESGPLEPGRITGVAPAATLVPVRTVKSVIQAFDSDVARAVAYSAEAQCDVISMSLGGRIFFGLERAVRYAVDQGLIVVAAAGNCVGFVVAPAVYDDTVAVAATNFEDDPWLGSSHGSAVTISAPGEDVWCAEATAESEPGDRVGSSDGTSFATAETAGIAALWLAHHGKAAIDAARGGWSRQALFVDLLTKTARVPDEWDASRYGPGIADAHALLEEPLVPSATPSPARATSNDAIALARMTDHSLEDFESVLSIDDLRRFGPELSAMALSDPEGFEALLSDEATAERNAAASRVRAAASEGLRAAIREQ